VIDACQSGRALESEERRHGPTNVKGLAQLAYEKNMIVLTASQSQQSALESEQLGHGYLTHVLVAEGFRGAADRHPRDGRVTVSELVEYAVDRVPQMHAELAAHRLLVQAEDRVDAVATARRAQQPVAFFRSDTPSASFVVAGAGATMDSAPYLQLVAAVRAGDLTEMDRLLAAGADAAEKDEKFVGNNEGKTLIHFAAGGESAAVVQRLLDRGADASAEAFYGWTPLLLAAHSGAEAAPDILRVLLRAGAAVGKETNGGASGVSLAAAGGLTDVLGVLLDAGGSKTKDGAGTVPLFVAAQGGHREAVQLLIERGVAADAPGPGGTTPLMAAAAGGYGSVVEALLATGASPAARDEEGWTALYYAASSDDDASIDALLRAGAEVNAITDDGITPLLVAANHGHARATTMLLKAGARPETAPSIRLGTPLFAATLEGHDDVVEALLAAGVSAQSAGPQSRTTALAAAIALGNTSIANRLRRASTR
jgi:cytohesin